ncbi:DUF3108 domain-containing protein [Caulobacter segnis]|uniref:DUF3108 domain-containing protein n=1 Tax=Caulobacter segnis TaxID=88688 RepID=UPI002867858C|nr:DUF3108 domain-containing protein [Caulobacter segnis]MDR6623999.1 hypothetical protein [Caulobacter segnis]
MSFPHRAAASVALAVALVASAASSAAWVAPTPVSVGQALARFDKLKPATHRYLRYRQMGDTITPLDVWTREIRIEPDAAGVKRLHIVQHWDGSTPGTVKTLDSWFELGTFRPFSHQRSTTGKDGQTKIEGFDFKPDRIVGLKDLPGNAQAAYDMASPQPAFNFETDMETLQALPLAAGYEAEIVFHHPGGEAPAPYRFKVTGSETLTSSAGGKVDCWVVTTDYNHPEWAPARFWLAKDSQVVVKVVSPAPDGSIWVKTLLW